MTMNYTNLIRYSIVLLAGFGMLVPNVSAQAWTTKTTTVSQFTAIGDDSVFLVTSIQNDKSGNIYLAGAFSGQIDFDPTSATEVRTSRGADDFFIAKFNTLGNLLWVNTYGSTGFDYINAMAVDNSGNIYVAGDFAGMLDFDLGRNETRLTPVGGADYFLMKVDSLGGLSWVTQGGNTEYDTAVSILLDGSGNVYFTGVFDISTDIDPSGLSTQNLFTQGQQDIFVGKYTNAGALIWGKSFGSDQIEGISSMALDSNGDLLLGGTIGGTTDFDFSAEGVNQVTITNLRAAFILRLTASGDFVWVRTIENDTSFDIYSLSVDTSGNTVIAGNFGGSYDLNPGEAEAPVNSVGGRDAFMLELDRAGIYVWSGTIAGAGEDYIQRTQVDATGNIYLVGQFSGNVDFDLGSGVVEKESGEKSAVFIAKYSSAGALSWVKTITATAYLESYVMKVDSSNNSLVGGSFTQSIDVDPSSSLGLLNSGEPISGFLLRLDSNGSAKVVTPTQKGVTSISGTARVSKVLTANAGVWAANPKAAISYQWYSCSSQVTSVKTTLPRGCLKITGAKSKTYTLKSTQVGKYVMVQVSASNGITTVNRFSKSTTKVSR